MSWREKLRDALVRLSGDEIEWSRQEQKLAAAAWLVTLVAFPVAMTTEGVLAGVAWGALLGLWIAGACYSLKEHGQVNVISRE